MKHFIKTTVHDKIVQPIVNPLVEPIQKTTEPITTFLNAENVDVFEKFYDFSQVDIIVIRPGLHESIRIIPDNLTHIDCKGNVEEYAQWLVHIDSSGRNAKLQNLKTMKYLRIHEGSLACDGDGFYECVFQIHLQSMGVVKLESVDYAARFIKINEDGTILVGNDDKLCRLMCYTRGQDNLFIKPYTFDKSLTILIEHIGLRYLGVKNADSEDLVYDGDGSQLSQWVAEPLEDKQYVKLKNHKTEKYIRIHEKKFLPAIIDCDGDGVDAECIFQIFTMESVNQVKLASVKYPNKYIAVDGTRVRIGKGGHHCVLNLYEKK